MDYTAPLAGALDFSTPIPLPDFLACLLDNMRDGMVHVTHPRYLGLFNPTTSFPAICAERLVAQLNPQLASARTAPFPVAFERALIGELAGRAGLPTDSGGHFTTSGSEANHTAALCALTSAHPDFATDGATAFRAKPAIYVSDAAHLAWLKIGHQCGIGRDAIRRVATDGSGRLDPTALRAAIIEDSARGWFPVMSAATAGTTAAGMIDPLKESRSIASNLTPGSTSMPRGAAR